ncbi:hypothetical protein ACFLXI_05135 [Chloroflexota bacterium]
MFQNKFAKAFHIPGTLSANITISFLVPGPCSLVHISACSSAASDSTLIVGTSADTNGFLESTVIGVSGTPVEFERADFDGALLTDAGKENPRLADGDIFVATLDYDGAAGTAGADVTLVFEFTEG